MVLQMQAPLVLLRSVKFYWQSVTREDRSHKSQNFIVAYFFLVGPIRVVGGLVELSQVVIRPYRITHGWTKGQVGLVLFTGKPSLVLPLFSFLSHSQATICFSAQTSVTRVRSSYTRLRTWVLNQEYLKWRDQESSRNENRWIVCGL